MALVRQAKGASLLMKPIAPFSSAATVAFGMGFHWFATDKREWAQAGDEGMLLTCFHNCNARSCVKCQKYFLHQYRDNKGQVCRFELSNLPSVAQQFYFHKEWINAILNSSKDQGYGAEDNSCHWFYIRSFPTQSDLPVIVINEEDSMVFQVGIRFINNVLLGKGVEQAKDIFHWC